MQKKDAYQINKNLERATSSFLENTLPIFLPVRDVKRTKANKIFLSNDRVLFVESLFGGVEIRGRLLGQNHKDILEMLLCQKKILIKSDNSIAVSFGRYKFLQSLGWSTGNYKWLEHRIKEIRDFNFAITYFNNEGKRVEIGGFGIIETYKFEEDGKMSIKFTKEFTEFYRKENLLDYSSYAPKIAKLDSPFVKAVVREMLKHKNYQIYFKNFIKNYNLDYLISEREIRNFKKILKQEDTKKMLKDEFNISIAAKNRDVLISISRDNSKVIMLENKENGYFKKIETPPEID